MYSKILVPLDGSELSECSLPHVKAIARGCNVPEVILLRVIEPIFNQEAVSDLKSGRDVVAEAERQNGLKVQAYLDALRDKLAADGISARTMTEEGRAADRIVDLADKEKVDLIIMSTHGRSGVTRWLLGSVAEKVLRHSRIPVLTVSPSAFRQSRQ